MYKKHVMRLYSYMQILKKYIINFFIKLQFIIKSLKFNIEHDNLEHIVIQN